MMLNTNLLLDSAFCSRLGLVLLHSLWQVAVLAMVAWGVERFCLKRLWLKRSVEHSYAVYVAALLLALVAMPVTFWGLGSGGEWLAPQTAEAVAPVDAPTSNVPPVRPLLGENFALPGAPAAVPSTPNLPVAPAQVAAPTVWQRAAPWLVVGYGLGVVLMLVRLVRAWVTSNRLGNRAEKIVDGPLVETLRSLARQWSMRVVPMLAETQEMVLPKVVGLARPMILLPTAAIAGLSPDELEMILAHELAHVRRHDMWVNLLQRLAEVVLFFNPALWYLSRRISTLREYCCDEMTCQLMANTELKNEPQLRYATALLHIAELAQPNTVDPSDLAALAATGRSPSELRRRVARLFGEPMREPVRVTYRSVLAIIAAFLVIGNFSLNADDEGSVAHGKDSSGSERPALETLLKKFSEHESAYFPYHIRAMETIRVAEDLPQDERKGYPWADGRKHQKIMEYAQKEPRVWIRKETAIKDGLPTAQFDQFFDGEKLLKIERTLDENEAPRVTEVTEGEELQSRAFVEPLFGVYPLPVYFNQGGLLSEAIQRGEIKVSLAWDGKDAKLSFAFMRSSFSLWLSAEHDWHPFKLLRFNKGEQDFFSKWEVTHFVKRDNRWRIATATHGYRYHPEIPGPRTARIRYSSNFQFLDAKYGDDVSEEIFEYETAKIQDAKNSMTLQVTNTNGKPIADAKVFQNHVTHTPKGKRATAIKNHDYFTDADGEAVITWAGKSKDLRIWVSKPGFVPIHAMWAKDFQIDGDILPKEFEVVLEDGTEIGGIVTDERGEPIEGVKVEIKDATASSAHVILIDDKEKPGRRPSRVAWLSEGETALRTDSEGRWVAKNVPVDSKLVYSDRGIFPGRKIFKDDPPLRLRFSHPDYKTVDGIEHANRKQNPSFKNLRSKTATVALKRGADKESEIDNIPAWPTAPISPANGANKRE